MVLEVRSEERIRMPEHDTPVRIPMREVALVRRQQEGRMRRERPSKDGNVVRIGDHARRERCISRGKIGRPGRVPILFVIADHAIDLMATTLEFVSQGPHIPSDD